MFRIVDWTTYTEIGLAGPFQTTGDDKWEIDIPMGSVPTTSNQIGIFLEPMSNDPQDAYPILSIDATLEGNSLSASVFDYTQSDPAPGDFLLDLWIWAPTSNKQVKAPKMKVDNSNIIARAPFIPVNEVMTVKQTEKGGKALVGYNVYYSHESDPFELLDVATDTTYTHAEAGMYQGLHNYYVKASYEEGESGASNTATEYIDGISDNMMDNLSVYPNPILDVVNIETDVNILSVKIVNSNGQVIFAEENISLKKYQLNLENQSTGIYNIRIETEDGWINRKMIKK